MSAPDPDPYGLGEAAPPAPAPFDAVDGLTYAGAGVGNTLHFVDLYVGDDGKVYASGKESTWS